MDIVPLDLTTFSEKELLVLFHFIEQEKRAHLTDELKFAIAKGNLFVRFAGDVLDRSQKYGLFFLKAIEINKEKNKNTRDFLITLRLMTESLSGNHLALFKRGGVSRLVVGGTTNQYRLECTEFSSHWLKIIDFQKHKGNPFYDFGKRCNEVLFKQFSGS